MSSGTFDPLWSSQQDAAEAGGPDKIRSLILRLWGLLAATAGVRALPGGRPPPWATPSDDSGAVGTVPSPICLLGETDLPSSSQNASFTYP